MPGPLPPELDLSAGEQRLGPYRLIRPISAGGMARVYEGRLDSLAGVSTRVAVKVIHPDYANEAAFQELFISEARISARLEHQNLVRIQQFNREGDLYYLVMEFIEGLTFRKIISQCRRHQIQLSVQVIAELGRQVCDGLNYAHSLTTDEGEALHLVHRDVKPSNLMLNAQGVAKVLDFGISYATDSSEAAGAVKGTWGYMALEQAEGHPVGPAADVFGLGAVLYEMATLEPLFGDKENAVIRQKLADDVAAHRAAALGGAYQDLGGVLVRALQRDPDARYRTTAGFGRALSTLVADPVGVHEQLLRLHRELRVLDGSVAPGAPDKARSVSTMSRASQASAVPGPPPGRGLPLRTGDVHGVARRRAPVAPAARSRVGLGVGAGFLVLLAVGVLGFAAWQLARPSPGRLPPSIAPSVAQSPPALSDVPVHPGDGAATLPPPPAPTPVPEPERVIVAAAAPPPTRAVAASRPAPSAPEPVVVEPAPVVPAPAPVVRAVAPPEAPAPHAADGLLTISSMPRAQVMIDGEYVRYTPLFQHTVASGSHTVVLVAEDGRRKTFKIDVPAGAEMRRIWLFDEEKWSEAGRVSEER